MAEYFGHCNKPLKQKNTMKNTIKFAMAVIICAVVFSSCVNNHFSKVTVIGKASNFSSKFKKVIIGEQVYLAVTNSKDTIEVLVDEVVAENNPVPYVWNMRKPDATNFGFIEAENKPKK